MSKHHVTKKYGRMEVKLHTFGNSALDVDEQSAWRFDCLNHWEIVCGIHRIGDWGGPRSGLGPVAQRKLPFPFLKRIAAAHHKVSDFQISLKTQTSGFLGTSQDKNFRIFRYLSKYKLQDFHVSLKIQTSGFSGISQDKNYRIFRYLSRYKLRDFQVSLKTQTSGSYRAPPSPTLCRWQRGKMESFMKIGEWSE